MKRLDLAAAAALSIAACGTLAACVTDPATGEVSIDWPTVATELELTAADIADASALVSDESLAEDLRQLATYLALAHDAILASDTGSDSDVLDLVGKALALADKVVATLPADDQGDLRAVLVIARSVLRRVEAYA